MSRLNDQSLIQLRKAFLDCEEPFSRFRLAAFMSSSRSTPSSSFKFVMERMVRGESSREYIFDVCIFSCATEELVAVGMQNNDVGGRATDARGLHEYLGMINDISAAHTSLRNAYYASSYGYELHRSRRTAKNQQSVKKDVNVEITFLEFQDGVYRQIVGSSSEQ